MLVVELLGTLERGRFQIHLAFQLFDVATILAYALAFVAVMIAIDLVLVQRYERHASRWRPRHA